MGNYLIAFDLATPGPAASALAETIKQLGSRCMQCLERAWLVTHNGPASAIRDRLQAHLGTTDLLVVLKIDHDWAAYRLKPAAMEWLKHYA